MITMQLTCDGSSSVIKRNLDNEELYYEESWVLHPLSEEAQEGAFELFGEIIEMD